MGYQRLPGRSNGGPPLYPSTPTPTPTSTPTYSSPWQVPLSSHPLTTTTFTFSPPHYFTSTPTPPHPQLLPLGKLLLGPLATSFCGVEHSIIVLCLVVVPSLPSPTIPILSSSTWTCCFHPSVPSAVPSLVDSCWLSYWHSVVGCWLSDVGCWLLLVGARQFLAVVFLSSYPTLTLPYLCMYFDNKC